jgi:sugar diacid utilization regulator
VRRPGPIDFQVWTVLLQNDPVGRVWVARAGSALSATDNRAVEHACIVLSLEIMRLRTAVEVEHRLRGELLADILGGADVASRTLLERAERLGHDLSLHHVAIVGRATPVDRQRVSNLEQRSLSAVAEVAAGRRPRPLVATYRGLVVTLWPTDGAEPPGEQSARRVGDIVRRAMTSVPDSIGATVAVSGPGHRNYPEAYRTARGALEIAERSGRTDITVTLGDLGVAGLLLQLDDADQLLAFADRTLAEVRRHDEQRGTELLLTLRCYLDNRQSRTAAARALHVHPNTVTQRLQRIQSLSGVDLGKPDTIVRIQAALTLIDVAQVDR